MLSDPLPPITTSASRPRSAIVAATSSTPVGVSNGLPRFVPSTVPPRGSVPRIVSTVSGIVRRSRTPSHASRKPISSSPWVRSPWRTMARITAFSPGQSPPPVSNADTHRHERTTRSPCAACHVRVLSIAGVGWDASRPVPWRRLAKEWLIYAGS